MQYDTHILSMDALTKRNQKEMITSSSISDTHAVTYSFGTVSVSSKNSTIHKYVSDDVYRQPRKQKSFPNHITIIIIFA